MSTGPGWHPDPSAPHTGLLRWWDGAGWTEHTHPAPATATGDPLSGPRALDADTAEHLIDGLVADQKRLEREVLWSQRRYDADAIVDDTTRVVRELARQLPADEPPLDLWHRARDPLVVVTGGRLLVLRPRPVEAGRAEDAGVEVDAVPFEALTLHRSKAGASVTHHRLGATVALPPPAHAWATAFLAGPRVRQGRLAELLGRRRRELGALPPDWYPDPVGQFEERFWDGCRWTDDAAGSPVGRLAVDLPPGPPALDDDAVAHLVAGVELNALRTRYQWIEGPDPYELSTQEYRMAFAGMQRHFPVADPPLDFRVERGRVIVVSARKVVVLGTPRARPLVEAEVHERVEVRKARALRIEELVQRDGDRLTLALSGPGIRWLQEFLAGPRVLRGRLLELTSRPHRDPEAPAPGWYPDPTGRFVERLWDGTAWTADVMKKVNRQPMQFVDEL